MVARYAPQYKDVYARLGWSMFASIDRVYDSSKAAERLGFVCRTTFASTLEALARRASSVP